MNRSKTEHYASEIVISKSYRMLCAQTSCRRAFIKIMLVKLKQLPEEKEVGLFEVQSLFNSTQNHECECPFCGEIAVTILSENLLMGSQAQLNYAEFISECRLQGQYNSSNHGGIAKGSTCASTSMGF